MPGSLRYHYIGAFDYLVPQEDLLALAEPEVEQEPSFVALCALCSSLSGIAPALAALEVLEDGALF